MAIHGHCVDCKFIDLATFQGVLLGQTSTGQTVILSTTSPIGNLHPTASGTQLNPVATQSHQPQQHSGFEAKALPQFNHTSVPTSSVLALLSPSVNTSSTNVSVSSSINTISISGHLQAQALNQRTVVTANGSPTPTLITTAVTSGTMQTQRMSGTSHTVTHTGVQGSSAHQVQHLGQNVVSVAQVEAQVQQQLHQSSSGSGPTPHLTSPFIIRSNQGDFVIPGHISLGRGMQGRISIHLT